MRLSLPWRLFGARQVRATASLGAFRAEFAEALGLAVRDGFVDLQDFEWLFLRDVVVYADHDLFFFFEGDLISIGSFGDFALRIAALDCGDHAAEGVDLFDVVPGAALDFVGQRFDEIGAAERIDGVCDAGFVGDDLLRAQRDRRREFGRHRPGFVERIGVQRLRAAENGGQRLQSRFARRCCRAAVR